jgi:Protein of unknown function (DUF1236)
MSQRLMITVATAALIAGAGLANAQGVGGGREGGAAGGAGTQQSAPSSPSGGATNHEGPAGGMKSSQSQEKGAPANRSAQEMKSPSGMGEKSAQDNKGGDRAKSVNSQNEEKGAPKGMKAEGQERNGDMKAEGREERNGNMKAEGREERNGNMKAEGRENNSTAASESRRTTGQAGAGAKLSSEQRTKITTIIRDQHVAPVANVDFAISVGTRVPREIGFRPLPVEIVTIYPEWRGYEFFLVRDQIVVVDPRTLEIVDVLPA